MFFASKVWRCGTVVTISCTVVTPNHDLTRRRVTPVGVWDFGRERGVEEDGFPARDDLLRAEDYLGAPEVEEPCSGVRVVATVVQRLIGCLLRRQKALLRSRTWG